MTSSLRILMAASLLVSFAASASAVPYKGYIRIAGIQGPSKDAQHVGWSELASSEITIDATPGEECKVLADALMKHAAPLALARVGDVVAEVEIHLQTNAQSSLTTFEALLEDVRFTRVTTASSYGRQFEKLVMVPESIEIETREIGPTGHVTNSRHFSTDCDGDGRLP